MPKLDPLIETTMQVEETLYATPEMAESVEAYHERHRIKSLGILTVDSAIAARLEVAHFAEQIKGKTVVEVGAGIGALATEMARHAKHVYAIEADPAWTWVYVEHLYKTKPANLTWIFGRAQDVAKWLRADVAVVYTHSDVKGMTAVARQMASHVIKGPFCTVEEAHPQVDPEEMAMAKEAADIIIAALMGEPLPHPKEVA